MVEMVRREGFRMACMKCGQDPEIACFIVKRDNGAHIALCEVCCREAGLLW